MSVWRCADLHGRGSVLDDEASHRVIITSEPIADPPHRGGAVVFGALAQLQSVLDSVIPNCLQATHRWNRSCVPFLPAGQVEALVETMFW